MHAIVEFNQTTQRAVCLLLSIVIVGAGLFFVEATAQAVLQRAMATMVTV